ncbi:transcriptional regulator [Bacillus cereus]|uniref:helix-turn-helix transcriptional regulator n=1 Tax=Bacillus nitratireducens TaxID=2026193 RepID=UPI000BF5F270|nr:helix-turn-helix transcriptional regulator [Bacillus nitratireducens]PES75015.1 transcriptional regulator [Bacillus cereus]MED0906141.1 helix-turn-helix transcriptional regulator [Bacillus nitratireducens]MED0993463.1 helix-turn-helix transcriptional regulator [Bacillus nitratireducens]PET03679.1 transcriptional regulator [Bacillus cereus]PFH91259.1 transcriptional regulator [Bacillus cereus]
MTVLREIRESKGYTIKEVSKGSKIPTSTLYDVESGRKGLIFSRAKGIADFFEEPIENIFFATYYRAKLE